MRRRSVSITGATGFVGYSAAEAFIRDGWYVRAIVRPGSRKPVPDGASVVEANLSPLSLVEACSGSDVLVHSAALIRARDEAAYNKVNVDGTRAAADAARQIGARLVLISSQAAGGEGTRVAPRREIDPPAPVNAYGRSKLASEGVVRSSPGLAWTILRPSAVYGPRDRGFLPLFRMARKGIFLVPVGADPDLTLVYVDDLVRAIVIAASNGTVLGETFFIGHGDPVKGSDVLKALAATGHRPFQPIRIPRAVMGALARLGDAAWKFGAAPLVDSSRLRELRSEGFVCSVDRARDLLGFTAQIALGDGIAQTGRWYADAGWV
jgi:nucleoside-diphosphate-sugar epimerase